jgi:hypothetical protein
MWMLMPQAIERRDGPGLAITLENYGPYCVLGLDYFSLDPRGRGTPHAQEVYLWCIDQGFDITVSERFDNTAILNPAQASAFKLRWF